MMELYKVCEELFARREDVAVGVNGACRELWTWHGIERAGSSFWLRHFAEEAEFRVDQTPPGDPEFDDTTWVIDKNGEYLAVFHDDKEDELLRQPLPVDFERRLRESEPLPITLHLYGYMENGEVTGMVYFTFWDPERGSRPGRHEFTRAGSTMPKLSDVREFWRLVDQGVLRRLDPGIYEEGLWWGLLPSGEDAVMIWRDVVFMGAFAPGTEAEARELQCAGKLTRARGQ